MVRWRAFPLRPNIPAEGVMLAQVAAEKGFQVKSMASRFEAIALEAGLAFSINEKIYNTRLAHELGAWATEQNKGTLFHHAVFSANYVEGKDISSIPVLVDLAQSVGLSGKDAMAVLSQRTHSHLVDDDWALCNTLDVVAAPTFYLNGNKLVGAQTDEKMARFVTESRGLKDNKGKTIGLAVDSL